MILPHLTDKKGCNHHLITKTWEYDKLYGSTYATDVYTHVYTHIPIVAYSFSPCSMDIRYSKYSIVISRHGIVYTVLVLIIVRYGLLILLYLNTMCT